MEIDMDSARKDLDRSARLEHLAYGEPYFRHAIAAVGHCLDAMSVTRSAGCADWPVSVGHHPNATLIGRVRLRMRMYLLRASAYKNSATRPTQACQQTKEDSFAADVLRRNDPRTEMTEYSNQLVDGENMVDRAAHSAEQLLEATRKTANSAIDSATDKVHAVQHRTSPALDRLMAPVDSLVERTRAAPLTSLLMAAAVGATLMALAGFLRPSRQR